MLQLVENLPDENENMLMWAKLTQEMLFEIKQIHDAEQYAATRSAVDEFAKIAEEVRAKPGFEDVLAVVVYSLAHLRGLCAAYEDTDPNKVLCDVLERARSER
jgi:hypothetical protein